MSKIYDALEYSQNLGVLRSEPLQSPSVFLNARDYRDYIAAPRIDFENEMVALYQSITTALPYVNHRSVFFVGTRIGEGTSTIAQELAKIVSLKMGKSVLLINCDAKSCDQGVYQNPDQQENVAQLIAKGVDYIEKAIFQVGESSLYVMPLSDKTAIAPGAIESMKGGWFWVPLKRRFDLIIVDSPPMIDFPDGPAIASHIDGFILVVDAEKTRWQVAASVKDKIVKSGGKILGVVLNKRELYIPQFIYRHL